MITLTKGYKQGRAVMFYDAFDELKQKEYIKVPKDEVVKFCGNGLISNAKVQWWQGKAIVRVSNNIPLVKITESGEIQEISKTVHNKADNEVIQTSARRRTKVKETDYKSYMMDDICKQRELKSTVSYTGIDTIGQLFDMIANDFNLKNKETYKDSFSKKIDLHRDLSSMSTEYKNNLVNNIAVYLMNMANIEIRDTYLKYCNLTN